MMPDQHSGVANAQILQQSLEKLTRVLASMVVLAYVVGVIVINTALAQYRVYSSNLLRVDYLIAGALWLVMLSYVVVVEAIIGRLWRWKTPDLAISTISLAILAWFLVLSVIADRDHHN